MPVLIRPLLCLIVSFWLTTAQADVTVYTAALIRTMEPALPEATAVAVQDGRIVAVGSLKDMEPVLRIRGGKDTRGLQRSPQGAGSGTPRPQNTFYYLGLSSSLARRDLAR